MFEIFEKLNFLIKDYDSNFFKFYEEIREEL